MYANTGKQPGALIYPPDKFTVFLKKKISQEDVWLWSKLATRCVVIAVIHIIIPMKQK